MEWLEIIRRPTKQIMSDLHPRSRSLEVKIVFFCEYCRTESWPESWRS